MLVVGVQVIVINLAINISMEVQIDVNGEYVLVFSFNLVYSVWYFWLGFWDINCNININEGNDCFILGVIFILLIDLVFVVFMQFGIDICLGIQVEGFEDVLFIISGFLVQVVVLSKFVLDQFSEFILIGQVYFKVENGVYKIRVGVFSICVQVDQVLKFIKIEGYMEVFIVIEQGIGQSICFKGYDVLGMGFILRGNIFLQFYN